MKIKVKNISTLFEYGFVMTMEDGLIIKNRLRKGVKMYIDTDLREICITPQRKGVNKWKL